MRVSKPEDMAESFVKAFNSGNPDEVLSLYEPDAVIVPPSGVAAKGLDAVRQVLNGFLALQGKIEIQSRYCFQTGDVALTSSRWALVGRGTDGAPIRLQGTTAEVVRRQADGSWLYVLDHPYGADTTP